MAARLEQDAREQATREADAAEEARRARENAESETGRARTWQELQDKWADDLRERQRQEQAERDADEPRRLKEEAEREAAKQRRREDLIARFGPAIAARILLKSCWVGQTREMLIEAWGRPVDIDEKILKTKSKHVFKYLEMGAGRFRLRVMLDDDVVVGWEDKR
ncbi:MAG: hypothetical protein ABIV93_07125 [Byssovorax sp.]